MTTLQQHDHSATEDLRHAYHELKKDQEVQAATQAGEMSTQAATHAGTWSTMIAGWSGFIIGIFMALAFVAVAKD